MLIFLRQGRTVVNAEFRLQGHIDHPLDALGIEQARRAGSYIRSRFNIAKVVSSPLKRAIETFEVADFGECSVHINKRW